MASKTIISLYACRRARSVEIVPRRVTLIMATAIRPTTTLLATNHLARQFARVASIRPTLDDVERLARGDATKRRGVGSRQVPHRLNAEERSAYGIALKRGYALLDGTGHRRHKDARGTPLLNILRQRADSLARPLVWVERHRSGDLWHACVDYSPVRAPEMTTLQKLHRRTLNIVEAEAVSVANVETSWPLSELESDHSTGAHGDGVVDNVESLNTRPIWALPACTARFGFLRDDEARRRECKRLAAALAREFEQ